MRLFALLTAILLMLTACSDSPSDSDVKEAIEARMHAEVQKQIDLLEQMDVGPEVLESMGGMPSIEDIYIDDLEVEDLSKDAAGDYVGEVSFVTHIGDQAQDFSGAIKMQRVEGEWQVSDI